MSIHVRAEDFFNAYEVLHESNKVLAGGRANWLGDAFTSKKFGRLPTMAVEIVCLSFSVELYVKYLYYVTTGKAPRGHNILVLFNKLSERIQQKIFSHPSVSKYGWTFIQFENEIEAISGGFEEWRYSHEVNTLRYNNYFALVFIEAIKSVAADE